MSQFFVDSKNIANQTIKITDKNEIKHIVKVRRFKEGDKIDLFDEKQNSYKGVIDKIKEDEIIVNIVGTVPRGCPNDIGQAQGPVPTKLNIELTIACALPKNAKFDYIVEKLTELGVFRIIPMVTKRTIVKLSQDKARARVARFRKIALEAAKQCNNLNIPIIDEVKNFKDLFKEKDFDLILIPTLVETQNFASLREIVETYCNASLHKILVLIGPEGDFSSEEIQLAIKHGARPVSLGQRVLKVDTAAIFVTSIINADI